MEDGPFTVLVRRYLDDLLSAVGFLAGQAGWEHTNEHPVESAVTFCTGRDEFRARFPAVDRLLAEDDHPLACLDIVVGESVDDGEVWTRVEGSSLVTVLQRLGHDSQANTLARDCRDGRETAIIATRDALSLLLSHRAG
jgi:hypothetical protein